jgi:serine acetyltransferase
MLAVFGPRFFIQHEPTDYKALLNELLAVGDDYDNAISVVIGQMNAAAKTLLNDVGISSAVLGARSTAAITTPAM